MATTYDTGVFMVCGERKPAVICDDDGMSNIVTLTCKAVLFDMDGTLVDSTAIVEHAWGGWAARHGIPLETVLSFSHGRPTSSTLEHFLPGQDHAEELQHLDRFEEQHLTGILPVPGAAQAVHAVLNHPWAVVTSAQRVLAEARMQAAGLPLPNVMVPVDEVRHGKPNPEGFLRAAALLGIAPGDCLVFEDTPPGIQAGLNAGMQVVALSTTMPAALLHHHPVIRDFHDVTIQAANETLTVALKDPSPRAR